MQFRLLASRPVWTVVSLRRPVQIRESVSDISGNGRVNSLDAALIAQFMAGSDVPEIPSIPAVVATFVPPTRRSSTGAETAAGEGVERITTMEFSAAVALPAAAVDRAMAEMDDTTPGDDDEQWRRSPLEEAVAALISL